MKSHPGVLSFRISKGLFLRYIYLLILALTLQSQQINIFAQQPTEEWVRRFSDTSSRSYNGSSIKSDSLGNIYVLARTGNNFGFIKYDQNGNLLLTAYYWPGGFFSGGGTLFDVTSNGNVYITGSVETNFLGWIYTVKFNSSGILQWGKLYNPDNDDQAEDIKVDDEGNIVIVGGSVISNNNYALILKYNSFGDTLWTKHFSSGPGGAIHHKFILDNFNNIYTTGSIGSPGSCLISKYSSFGNLEWFKKFTFDSTRTNIGMGLAFDNLNNIYVAGTQVWFPFGNIHDYLLKVDNSGTLQWSRKPNLVCNGGYMTGPVVSLDGNSIYYITEGVNGTGGGGHSITTVKYNSNGDSQWVKMYSGGVPATLNSIGNIKLDRFGHVYVCGAAYYMTTGSDFTTIKYTPSGVEQWVITYTGLFANSGDYANDMYIDTNIIVYSTGLSKNQLNNGYNAVTIKYSQPIGINNNNNELPVKYKLFQNYPNPFNVSTVITYQLPKKSYIVLDLFNVNGQLIRVLKNNTQEAGYYSDIIDMSNFASGIYFYTLKVDNKIYETKKMILVK